MTGVQPLNVPEFVIAKNFRCFLVYEKLNYAQAAVRPALMHSLLRTRIAKFDAQASNSQSDRTRDPIEAPGFAYKSKLTRRIGVMDI